MKKLLTLSQTDDLEHGIKVCSVHDLLAYKVEELIDITLSIRKMILAIILATIIGLASMIVNNEMRNARAETIASPIGRVP